MKKLLLIFTFTFNLITNAQTNPTGNSNEVGNLKGELSVSLNGAANYFVPISVPPGINNIAPQLGLSYNSQGGSGLAGYGWNISGLSVITRIPSTKFHDNVSDPIDIDSNDKFALDGQRLILLSGTYLNNGSTYTTENYSNLKITFNNNYFIVNYPDGTYAYYGNSTNSKSLTSWAINLWSNQQNVKIEYSYYLENNNLNIKSIKYGHNLLSTFNEIIFNYTNRSRTEQGYINGQNIENKKLLNNIVVNGIGACFRNYQLEYTTSNLGYDKLTKITEKSGDNSLSLNPTVFHYGPDTTNWIDYQTGYTLDKSFEYDKYKAINGDFDGDGNDDYILQGKTFYTQDRNKIYLYRNLSTGTNSSLTYQITSGKNIHSIFPSISLNGNATSGYKINPNQTFTVITQIVGTTSYAFETYKLENSIISLDQRKNFTFPCSNTADSNEMPKKFLSGDFNGDGLTDSVMIIGKTPTTPMYGTPNSCSSIENKVYFIDLKKDVTALPNYFKYCGKINNSTNTFNNIKEETVVDVLDFNGDGKSDFVIYFDSYFNVYTFNDTYTGIVLLCSTNYTSSIAQKFIGDFNGDGKSDITFADVENYSNLVNNGNWKFYISNGNSFISFTKNLGIDYAPYRKSKVTYQYEDLVHAPPVVTKETHDIEETIFFVKDFNGDGKSDIMLQKHIVRDYEINREYIWDTQTYEYVYDYSDRGETQDKYLRLYGNRNIGTNNIVLNSPVVVSLPSTSLGAIPIMSNFNKNDYFNLDYSYIVGNRLFLTASSRNHATDILLNKITLGNGITEKITYKSLKVSTQSTFDDPLPIYFASTSIENYPNYDIKNATSLKVVSKLEKQTSNTYNKKLFSYYGGVINYNGLGFLGFRSTMQTNWFNDDANIISNITKSDMNLRGSINESYVVEGLQVPSSNFNPSTFISKTLITYNTPSEALLANKVFKLQKKEINEFDGLANTKVKTFNFYNANNNLTQILESHYTGIGTGTMPEISYSTNFTYDTLISSPYTLDRLKTKTNYIYSNNGNSSTEEVYTYYTGVPYHNLPMEVKKKSNTSNYVTENYEYSLVYYGNVTKKTTTAPGLTNRITQFDYDNTGRFITSKTDVEGLITNYTYDQTTGNLLSETLPSNAGFPLVTSYQYDKWGKQKKIIDYLGNEVKINYENQPFGGVKMTNTGDDGSVGIKILDDLGRTIHEGSKLIDDDFSYTSTVYNSNSQPIIKSQPYLESNGLGNYEVWNAMSYDKFGRLIESIALKSNNSSGKITTYSYNGLSTTESDNLKTKVITKNSIGQIIILDESDGGTINYSYFSNGELKSTNYNGVITTLEQDIWGRKSKLIDPSAGTFQYFYNDFGDITKEIAPKGETNYTYDNTGKLIQKTIVGLNGDTTNSKTTYAYNPNTKLITKKKFEDFTEGFYTDYSYTYDNYKRLSVSDESGFNAYYQWGKFYDNFGRLNRELYTAINTADSKRSDLWINHTYKNGIHYQIKDDNNLLWQTTSTTAQGKILSANYGNDVIIENKYDEYGFPKLTNHYISNPLASVNIMNLETIFEPVNGNLIQRNYNFNGTFFEDFQYDSLDRLSEYPDSQGNIVTQKYDYLGRILKNPLGKYNYEITNKVFQNSSIALDAEAFNYYQNRNDIDITYNAFKAPISIFEDNKDRINFTYNMNNNRSTMYYGSLDVDKYDRKLRKHYSIDGTMEIKQDIANGTVEFITYIGGDAYSAPVILKSDGADQNYYYLHRDYQGSILAISDQQGIIVEKRAFDVWGNISQIQDQNGDTLERLTFIDRGYTGHEHLQEVALIHMNGRLYDPVVHRFLQPDNNIQDPFNTQNYNRYSYVMNNPTKYNDPSGEFWSFVIGALFSAYANGVQSSGGQLNPFKWDSTTWINAGLGAAGSTASTATTNYLNSYVDNYGKKPVVSSHGSENPIEYHEYCITYGDSFSYLNFETKLLLDKIENAGYSKFQQVSHWGDDLLMDFARKVFTKQYNEAGNPYITKGNILVDNSGNAQGVTMKQIYFNDKTNKYYVCFDGIQVSIKNGLNNILRLGMVIGHELSHGADYVKGDFAKWINKYNNFEAAHILTEVRAWTFTLKYNDGTMTFEEYNNYYNKMIQNNLKF